MNKSPQYNQQTEPKQRQSEVEEIPYGSTKIRKVAVTASLYLKEIPSAEWDPCQKEFQATTSESSHVQ